jgi:tRNA (adenine57-N1/adenine58-N1)-methyltransferase catalytic subunit
VNRFRRGIYSDDIDFHVGNLSEFFATQDTYGTQFLTHAILDMPSTDDQLMLVSKHLKPGGVLLVFNPSVTQITDCVKRISQEDIPLSLERVLELAGSFSGGREWDVRLAKIRNSQQEPSKNRKKQSLLSRLLSILRLSIQPNIDHKPNQDWAVVCRPKAGDRIPVGGFVGIWRKT